ncbi:hypothetical protein H920_09427 [Fukomys damarensis]|uniref:Uncharacterized protein n=1 Tax=Fukomys damarensis TaxID=885580 RepID=A0A091DDS1_FUKDA|nr:hypothetical protein H920_09427 [Fukomys damarensis]
MPRGGMQAEKILDLEALLQAWMMRTSGPQSTGVLVSDVMGEEATTEDLYLGRPEISGRRQKIYTGEMKDLCHQAEGSTLGPGSDAHSKHQSSLDELQPFPVTVRPELFL